MNKDKIKIDKNNTIIGRAVNLSAVFSNIFVRLLFLFLWLIGILSIIIIINRLIGYESSLFPFFGYGLIFFAIFLFYLADRAFYLGKAKHPQLKSPSTIKEKLRMGEEVNLYEYFSFGLAKATADIFGSRGYTVTPDDLLLAILNSPDMDFILCRLGFSRDLFHDLLKGYSSNLDVRDILTEAVEVAIMEDHHQIEVGDIFVSFSRLDPFMSELLKKLKLTHQDIQNIVYWQTFIVRKIVKQKKFFDPTKFNMTGGIGRDWAFGWTPLLRQFSIDITSQAESDRFSAEMVGREKEIEQIKEALLRQNGGNAIIVGDPGIGKETTVMSFAHHIAKGETYSPLDFRHMIKIDTEYLLSGLTNPGEITERANQIFSEAIRAGNIIIFLQDIQNLLSDGDAGKVDLSSILIPFLDYQNMHIIATTDVASYNQYIQQNNALSQRFTRVSINEPSNEQMIRILEDLVPYVESRNGILITYEAIKEIIHSADKYIFNIPNPEKCINLLDSVAAHVAAQKGSIIMPKDVLSFISVKYEIPADEADDTEKEKLLNLEANLHKQVIGQSEAINAISNALRRARAGVNDSKKPIGSFLFLGPTGVGKTETAKALARSYFDKEDRMIRFDMSEYQNKEDIYRLIGSNLHGSEMQGTLTTAITEKPFSLVLFDEIEKAHPDILDLFLQLLDEGFITDGSGRKVSFTNSIIIATSNAGSELIRSSISSGTEYEKIKMLLIDYLQKNNIYRPEFLNRFNGVIAFSPLSQEEILQVAGLMLQKLHDDMVKNKAIEISFSPEAIFKLAQAGYDPKMGARPMIRTIEEKVENYLAKRILSGTLNKGDQIKIEAADLS